MELEVKTTIDISLNKDEARWLKSLVQNPINCVLEKEDERDSRMRKRFWEALKVIDLF